MQVLLALIVVALLGVLARKVHAGVIGLLVSAVIMLLDYRSTYNSFLQIAMRSSPNDPAIAKTVANLTIAIEFVIFAAVITFAVWLLRKVLPEKKVPPQA